MHALKLRLRARDSGTSLVIVLIIAMTIGGFAAVMGSFSTQNSQAQAEWRSLADDGVACESVAELLRAELVADLQNSNLSVANWLTEVRDGNRFGTGVVKSYAGFPGVQTWVSEVSAAGGGSSWVEVTSSTQGVASTQQSATERFNMGNSSLLDFAMLTKNTNCMFCHLEVNGDVGSLANFMPGWGGQNSGYTSSIDGDVYVAGTATMGTGSFAGTLNGTALSGSLHENYTGSKLPADENGDGEPDFPSIDAAAASETASGSIWAGNASNTASDGSGIWVTPLLGDWDPSSATPQGTVPPGTSGTTWMPDSHGVLSSSVDGNLTLVGTYDNPIQLNGDVFASGDVVIKGYVEGKGAVYAGRNVYIAGDIVYKNPPGTMTNDAEAVAAIAAGSDELRLAAKANVVIGNWTYKDNAGNVSEMRDRQGAAFMYTAHSLENTSYFKATDGGTSSEELTKSGSQYYDDLGNEVSSSNVITINDSTTLGWVGDYGNSTTIKPLNYDSRLAAGQVKSDGSFHSWMSQNEFRSVLGTQNYTDMMWRMPWTSSWSTNESELGAGWGGINGLPNWTSYYAANYHSSGNGQYVKRGGAFTYILETGTKAWATHVTHIDAFIYSNKRVSGLTPMVDGLVINGGMISGDIQVLAPGRGNWMWWATAATWGDPTPSSYYWTSNSTPNAYGDAMDALRLNYDYRLRNGGLGFNLLSAATGERIYIQRGAETLSGFPLP